MKVVPVFNTELVGCSGICRSGEEDMIDRPCSISEDDHVLGVTVDNFAIFTDGVEEKTRTGMDFSWLYSLVC